MVADDAEPLRRTRASSRAEQTAPSHLGRRNLDEPTVSLREGTTAERVCPRSPERSSIVGTSADSKELA
jgi:hypothetical protein